MLSIIRIFSFLLLFFQLSHGLGLKRHNVVFTPGQPVRYPPTKPVTNSEVEALPPYTTVIVATIHFEFTNKPPIDVPQVNAELNAMRQIFLQYNFDVRDITIPKSKDAEAVLTNEIASLFAGLKPKGSLVILIYGGHGTEGGKWLGQTSGREKFEVDWPSIDARIIAPTGIDNLQIIDACYAGGFVPSENEATPSTWNGRGAFNVLAAASTSPAGTNELAFTKAVIHTLAPGDDGITASFTPQSLFNALPLPNEPFALLISDQGMYHAMISGEFIPKFFELASTTDRPAFKIARLPHKH